MIFRFLIITKLISGLARLLWALLLLKPRMCGTCGTMSYILFGIPQPPSSRIYACARLEPIAIITFSVTCLHILCIIYMNILHKHNILNNPQNDLGSCDRNGTLRWVYTVCFHAYGYTFLCSGSLLLHWARASCLTGVLEISGDKTSILNRFPVSLSNAFVTKTFFPSYRAVAKALNVWVPHLLDAGVVNRATLPEGFNMQILCLWQTVAWQMF